MATRPFPVNDVLTQIAIAYRNPDVAFIADDVLPITPVSAEFKWLRYDLAQGFTVPDAKVGRKSKPTEVEFAATEQTDRVVDYAFDDFVPQEDITDDNQGVDPLGTATMYLRNLLMLAREQRAAATVFAAGNHANSATLSGTSQWSDYTNSDPVTAIMNALDVPVMRPNIAVFGQATWTRLRMHPRVIAAVFGSNQSGQMVSRQQVADLFEIQAVYVGAGFVNAAKRGQTASLARVWGKHAAFLYRERAAGPQAGVTYGFTAQAGGLFAGNITDEQRGMSGGQLVRVGHRQKEIVAANDLSYYFANAVA
jgi:hypothetical protein